MGKKLYLMFLLFLFIFIGQTEASITLRVVAVNPSEEFSQSAPIKVYLPVEVKPEHIIYKEDLEIAYDTQQGSYYVFGEYELQPLEVKELEIEIEDIWVVDEAQILAIRQEAGETFKEFEKTSYAQRAQVLQNGIEKKLKEIVDKQAMESNNPSQHISDYRYCLKLLDSVQEDLVAAKTLLSEIKPKGLIGLTWKIIVFIIAFLGILGLAFYIIWQRQAKLEQEQKKEEASTND